MPLTETGSDELAAALAGIALGLGSLSDASNETARIVVARARRMVPTRTGKLSRSIRGTSHGSTAVMFTDVPYALPVHFGVPKHNMKPVPFLFAAVDSERTRILDAYTANVARLIEQKV